jgi:ABC-type Na+ transport system ATPase subunit NatA
VTRTGAAIEARELTKTYGGGVRALDGLGFTVEAGTVFGLLGPNGAGKSTTVKILTTLSRPDSGQATVAGVDVLAHPERVRRAIGLVAQRSGVDLEATGRENLTLQGQVYGLRGAELRGRVGELLERFGLAEAADRVARGYSGGMQRRLDIAMGLIHRPRVLFLDEPTTGLDPEVRADMWAEIAHLSAEGLSTTVTHSWFMTMRHLRNLARQPWWIAITLVQPVIWLLLFGAVFKATADIPGFVADSYVDYLTPGIVVMTAAFAGGWAGMGVIEDLNRGVIDRFLVSPAARPCSSAARPCWAPPSAPSPTAWPCWPARRRR